MDKPIMDKFENILKLWINTLWVNYSEIQMYGYMLSR